MSTIDSNSAFSPLNSNMIRAEYRVAQGGNSIDKPSFGERVKLAFAKIGRFLGRVAGAVLPFFGPLGSIGASAAYGLQRISEGALQRIQARRAQETALDAQASRMSGGYMATPGFGGTANFPSSFGSSELQWAPHARGYENNILSTLNNKGAAAASAINQL